MNSSMYLVIGILIVATGLLTFATIWDHKPARAFGYAGLLAIFGGVGLNLYALRHVVDGVNYGWTAGLPNFMYDAPLWTGITLVVVSIIVRNIAKRKFGLLGKIKTAERTRDTHEVV